MDTIFNFLLDHAFELLTSAGLVGIYMARENRRTVKIDNDRKVMDDLVAHLERLKKELNEMEERYNRILKAKDERIAELETKVKALENELEGMRAKRNAKGQFVKRPAKPQTQQKVIDSAMVSQDEI